MHETGTETHLQLGGQASLDRHPGNPHVRRPAWPAATSNLTGTETITSQDTSSLTSTVGGETTTESIHDSVNNYLNTTDADTESSSSTLWTTDA